MIETGTLLQDRYLIERQIGAGGMGAVYIAVDQRFDNHVAIKETFYKDEELTDAFEREARLLNGLQHPALPHVSDYFAEQSGYFLVMQYIEGEDLSDILKRDGAFPAADVLRWADRLLDALDYLHTQTPPIIHRDIKPHNLKLTRRGDIMLLDFGLAKLKHDNTTGSLSVFGFSRTYSPLEQIQGTGTDARSDIFALGATLYHLLTGKPPADALSRAAAIVNGKSDPLRPASEINAEVPPAVANIINSALALNPDQRFVSAGAMRQALSYAAADDSTLKKIETISEPVIDSEMPPPVIISAENDNFPALEAFAAEVENNSPADLKEAAIEKEASYRTVRKSDEAPEKTDYSTVVVAAPPQNFSKEKFFKDRKQLVYAGLAALLIFGIVTALYLFGNGSTAKRQEPTTIVETLPTPNINGEKPGSSAAAVPDVLPESVKKTPVLLDIQKAENIKAENVSAVETPAVEPSKSSPPVKGAHTRPGSSAGKKTEPVNSGETRNRIVRARAEDDAESDPYLSDRRFENRERERERRRRARRLPDDLSEEEFEQLRRERRQRRWNRRSRPLPF